MHSFFCGVGTLDPPSAAQRTHVPFVVIDADDGGPQVWIVDTTHYPNRWMAPRWSQMSLSKKGLVLACHNRWPSTDEPLVPDSIVSPEMGLCPGKPPSRAFAKEMQSCPSIGSFTPAQAFLMHKHKCESVDEYVEEVCAQSKTRNPREPVQCLERGKRPKPVASSSRSTAPSRREPVSAFMSGPPLDVRSEEYEEIRSFIEDHDGQLPDPSGSELVRKVVECLRNPNIGGPEEWKQAPRAVVQAWVSFFILQFDEEELPPLAREFKEWARKYAFVLDPTASVAAAEYCEEARRSQLDEAFLSTGPTEMFTGLSDERRQQKSRMDALDAAMSSPQEEEADDVDMSLVVSDPSDFERARNLYHQLVIPLDEVQSLLESLESHDPKSIVPMLRRRADQFVQSLSPSEKGVKSIHVQLWWIFSSLNGILQPFWVAFEQFAAHYPDLDADEIMFMFTQQNFDAMRLMSTFLHAWMVTMSHVVGDTSIVQGLGTTNLPDFWHEIRTSCIRDMDLQTLQDIYWKHMKSARQPVPEKNEPDQGLDVPVLSMSAPEPTISERLLKLAIARLSSNTCPVTGASIKERLHSAQKKRSEISSIKRVAAVLANRFDAEPPSDVSALVDQLDQCLGSVFDGSDERKIRDMARRFKIDNVLLFPRRKESVALSSEDNAKNLVGCQFFQDTLETVSEDSSLLQDLLTSMVFACIHVFGVKK
mgnify:CR=1 FL=1